MTKSRLHRDELVRDQVREDAPEDRNTYFVNAPALVLRVSSWRDLMWSISFSMMIAVQRRT
jgi:hypothetical protein